MGRGFGAAWSSTGRPASRNSLSNREYQHLFPAAPLLNDGCVDDSRVSLGLNLLVIRSLVSEAKTFSMTRNTECEENRF